MSRSGRASRRPAIPHRGEPSGGVRVVDIRGGRPSPIGPGRDQPVAATTARVDQGQSSPSADPRPEVQPPDAHGLAARIEQAAHIACSPRECPGQDVAIRPHRLLHLFRRERHDPGGDAARPPAHLFGQPADMTSIMRIANRFGLRVIEDSCEAAGVHHRGRPVGSFGDFGCFSTYMAHLVTTGVGGLALSDDEELSTRFRSLMNHGRDPRYLRIDDDEGLDDGALIDVVWSRYRFMSRGQSFRATEMEAALGIGQLERLGDSIAARRRVAAMLTEALNNDALQLPYVADGNEHAFMMYPIVCREASMRDRIIVALERGGVETRLMLPILGQPCYSDLNLGNDMPVARWIGSNGFYVGCHQDMTEADVQHIAGIVTEALR